MSYFIYSSFPYGIESFSSVLGPLGKGTLQHRGKGLAAFMKAIGYIIPLMEPEHARLVLAKNRDGKPALIDTIVREFASQDEEMRKIVMKVCFLTKLLDKSYLSIMFIYFCRLLSNVWQPMEWIQVT